MPTLRLTKHHGSGNDFLVLLDPDGVHPIDAGLARALCDRHTGVGADGLIRASAGTAGTQLTFELRNADGSAAEMSGNGMRCLAQAAVDAGLVDGRDFIVATAAGQRAVSVHREEAPGLRTVSVDMGAARVSGSAGRATVDVGNPHLVLQVGDAAALAAPTETPDPAVNVELVLPGPEPDALTMRVFERGVGETLACGTGAIAAAAAAHQWGLVGTHVVVHQRGGDGIVDLCAHTTVLTGPTQRVARVEVDRP